MKQEFVDNGFFISKGKKKKNIVYYLEYLLLILMEWGYKFLLLFGRKQTPKKYYLSFCSIFKNEAPYMKEWIEYHLLVGVDHFYLYNNNSTDNYQEVLQPYIDKGIVTLTEWPEVPGQITAFKHCYENYRQESNWMCFPDLDEFICPLEHNSIPEWLKRFKRYPLVMVYWRMFGTSGLLEHNNNRLLIEQYFNSWPKLTSLGKLFLNTEYEIGYYKVDMMHYFLAKWNKLKIPPINQFGHFVLFGIHRHHKKVDIQMNHYWSKAYSNYEAKHKRGSACWGKSWKTFDKFVEYEQHNTSSDYAIYRFLIQLKLKMTGNYPKNDD